MTTKTAEETIVAIHIAISNAIAKLTDIQDRMSIPEEATWFDVAEFSQIREDLRRINL